MGTDLVLVVGPSGAGIRTTIAILEDLFGYAAMTKVDPRTLVNLVRMLPNLDKDRWKKLALHVGMRRMSGEDLFREHSKE
jgi:RNase adaptor protein for sRNA GlmZ degradation